MNGMKLIILVLYALIVWNIIVFLMMGVDKWKAKRAKRRISEKTLLLSSLLFGALGGCCGMYLFHHKTLHNRFRYGLPAMLVLHLIFLACVARCFSVI